MASEAHVYDLFDLEGKRIGVCMPSREERKAQLVRIDAGGRHFRYFAPMVVKSGAQKGQIISYHEMSVARPKVIIYGR